MDSKEHLLTSCDASSTKTIEIQWVPNVSIPKIKKERVESSDEEELPLSVYKHRCEPLESTEYINHYDCKDYVLKQVKKEFPEEEYPQAGCSLNSNVVEEDKELLKPIDRQQVKVENTEEGVFINIKQEHDDKIYEIPIKKEKLEEQELLDNNGDTDAQYDSLLVPREIQKILDARKLKKPTQQSLQGSQNIIKIGHNQDQLSTSHGVNIIEQNREESEQLEEERRTRLKYLQSIAVVDTTSNIKKIDLTDKKVIHAFLKPKEMNARQKNNYRKQIYRERNKERLKQRAAEKRRRLKHGKMISELSTSSNTKFTESVYKSKIDETSTDSPSATGLKETQRLSAEVSQRNQGAQSSANGTELPNTQNKSNRRKLSHIIVIKIENNSGESEAINKHV